jgi:tetratricopeptide (TPR) repeat protein
MKNLALLYSNPLYKQDYEQAGKLFLKALEIREKVLGSDHPETGKLLSLLATYMRGQGQYKEAEVLYERALKVLKELGTDNIYVARVLNNLGKKFL